LVRQLASGLQVFERCRHCAARARERLDDEAGHLVAVLLEMLAQHARIVEAGDDDLIGHGRGETFAFHLLESIAKAHTFEPPGLRAVPAAAHFHHQTSPGEGAGE